MGLSCTAVITRQEGPPLPPACLLITSPRAAQGLLAPPSPGSSKAQRSSMPLGGLQQGRFFLFEVRAALGSMSTRVGQAPHKQRCASLAPQARSCLGVKWLSCQVALQAAFCCSLACHVSPKLLSALLSSAQLKIHAISEALSHGLDARHGRHGGRFRHAFFIRLGSLGPGGHGLLALLGLRRRLACKRSAA